MANIKQISDGGPDGMQVGQSASDLIGWFGATPTSRIANISVVTGSTIATLELAFQTLVAALKTRGQMASS